MVGRVHEHDVGRALASPPLEERARLPVAVLLRDDAAAARDRTRVNSCGDRGHPGHEAGDGLDVVELGKRVLERGRGRRAVASVDVARPVVAEDRVLLGG